MVTTAMDGKGEKSSISLADFLFSERLALLAKWYIQLSQNKVTYGTRHLLKRFVTVAA